MIFHGIIAWVIGRANRASDEVNRAASTLAKEGARQRRESYEAKKARVHAELEAFVRARRAMG